MEKNITLDFTAEKAVNGAVAGQPLAIMPALLAKKLLKDYAKKLQHGTAEDILRPLINSMEDLLMGKGTDSNSESVYLATQLCAEFIQERTLIDNCAQENWDAFTVVQPLLD